MWLLTGCLKKILVKTLMLFWIRSRPISRSRKKITKLVAEKKSKLLKLILSSSRILLKRIFSISQIFKLSVAQVHSLSLKASLL